MTLSVLFCFFQLQGDLVYANYGKTGDFEYLLSKGVNCSGKIVIVKYGHIFRGDKVQSSK